MTMCETCEEVQQQLLADGEGACGQIICNHQDDRTLVLEDEAEDDTSAVLSTFSPTTAAVDMLPKRDSRKRKFPTMKMFAEAGGDKMKRKVAPIEKWTSLKLKELFLVKRVISIDVIVKKKKKEAFYAEFEDADETLKNVWLTDIIKNELDNHFLEEGNTFIMALGLAESKETGNMYHNFAVQDIKDIMM